MVNNNNLIFNAALAGFMAGAFGGTYPIGLTSGQAAVPLAAALAWAKELDSLIATDTTISGGSGVTLLPTSAAITSAQAAKTEAIQSISYAFSAGRSAQDPVQGDYANAAAAAVIIYNSIVSDQTFG